MLSQPPQKRSRVPEAWRQRAAEILLPKPESHPDQWGAANRKYPLSSGRPGPRDPAYTPYGIPFGRSVASRRYRRVVAVFAAQSGKTDALLDVIGQRAAERPGPILYVGPNQKFLNEQFEPRITELLDQSPTLRNLVATGKRMTKTRKVINGNPLRLAHASSSTALKSDPAALAIVDEADELMANVKKQGNPIGLVEARGVTQPEFTVAIVSTPSEGPSETEVDPVSGLEFWKPVDPKVIHSTIWKLWQSGTMRHWAVPCPECSVYFIPRFSCVEWPEKVIEVLDGKDVGRKLTPSEVRRSAFLRCQNKRCRAEIWDDEEGITKAEMNRRGVYVAKGQKVDTEGVVTGDLPESDTDSFWCSGLMSPFRTVGFRAAEYVEAARTGGPDSVRTVINAGMGELYFPRTGDAPEWQEVAALRLGYRMGEMPAGILLITAGVDVQKDRLVYVIRGWGRRMESWLILHGEIFGDPRFNPPWQELHALLHREFDGLMIRRAIVDSGFRPGKVDEIPENMVYSFCRVNARICMASKGYPTRKTPLSVSHLEVTPVGGVAKRYGLDLARLDSDFFKSWVHERVRWQPDAPGAWHLPVDATEDYCRQIVSEARARTASGAHTWVPLSRRNHFLDAEALSTAAAWLVGVQRISDSAPDRKPGGGKASQPDSPASAGQSPAPGENPYARKVDEPGDRPPITNRKPSLTDIGDHPLSWDDF